MPERSVKAMMSHRPLWTRFVTNVKFLTSVALVAAMLLSPAVARGGPQSAPRPLPDSTNGIHVFNDQLAWMSPEQVAFAATHYAGTQKMTRADAEALRAVNPNFVILHYRLGLGLGYRTASAGCIPDGEYLQIIDSTWTPEWPGDAVTRDSWFYRYTGQRVYQCQWGWYLMELDDPAWRTWWSDAVMQQMADNDDDGLFADSFSVPNELGGFSPALPGFDPTLEAQWTARLQRFTTYLQSRFAGRYYFIPNVGFWVTTRDATNYSGADGVMIEGFGYDAWLYFGATDWALQLNRVLSLVNRGRAVIGQSYEVDSPARRLFSLGSYLLIKGSRTYVNLDTGLEPEWWPEYEIPIGSPTAPTPADMNGLFNATWGVYAREYSNGLVLVNPGDGGRAIALGRTYYLAQASGGGTIPSNGLVPASWTVSYTPVSGVTIAPGSAAILLASRPGEPPPTGTIIPTPTATASRPMPSWTPTRTATAMPTPSATLRLSATPTRTWTRRPRRVPTPTPTRVFTRSPTPTWTRRPTATATPRPTRWSTASPTRTWTRPPTFTRSPTPTATHTRPPTATWTRQPTWTPTRTVTPTNSRVPTPAPTSTMTRTAASSATPTPAATATPTRWLVPSATATTPLTGGAALVTERWGAHASAAHGGTMDVSLDAANPTWSANDGPSLVIGEPAGGQEWTLLRFDVSALTAGTAVRVARLRLALFSDVEPLDAWLPVHLLTDPDRFGLWSETDATFNQRRLGVPWSAQGDLTTALGPETGRAYLGNLPQWRTTWVEWDVTAAVRQWAAQPSTIQGLVLPSIPGGLYEVPSRTNSDPNLRPYLEITYEGPNPHRPVPVAGVNAFHRAGQTFITWSEIAAAGADVRYRVYRHTEPITAASLGAAAVLAEVEQNSGYYEHEATGCSGGADCSPIGQSRFIIQDNGAPLPEGVGLFVGTVHETEVVSYYAVTSVANGNENRDDFGGNRAGPLVEAASVPRPVRVWTNATGTAWVYTQFMDYANWNPAVEGYAYNFYVGVPAGYRASASPLPLLMQLHAYTGTYRLASEPAGGGTDYSWPVVEVFPDDRTNTWWFGFGRNAGVTAQPLYAAPIVDYTHQRLDALLDFVASEFGVDLNRMYLWGGSMGGSGTVHYGLRRGDRFAAIYAESAMTNFAAAGAAGGAAWESGEITRLWGTVEQNLATNLGLSIWEWYNLQRWVQNNPAARLPFLADHHGRNDNVIDWETQGAPWCPALEAGRHGLVGVFDHAGHSWPGFVADSAVFTLTDFSFRRDESFPALSNASNSNDPATSAGCRNCRIEWSSSWLNFAGAPVDSPGRYEVVLRTNTGTAATVDVTPRRLQAFTVSAGAGYAWEDRRLNDNLLVAYGTVFADADGLITIRALPVSAAGNRLILQPVGGTTG